MPAPGTRHLHQQNKPFLEYRPSFYNVERRVMTPLPPWRPPLGVRAIFRALLPIAERDEVLSELTAEFQRRVVAQGELAARRWAWRQALGSTPALLRRGWWRGMTGFEPDANRLRPGGPMYESWIMDGRYAVRRLISRPVYAALAIATLALGAGGTAAVSSVAGAILLDPLPIVKEEQVGVLWFGGSWREQEFLRLRPNFPGFQRMAAYRPEDVTLESAGQPLRLIPGIAVSAELFDVLGRPAMLGRTFKQGEDLVGAEMVAVLSHSLWEELGSDPDIVGKPLQLGGVARTVVGVMPQGFWFPSPATRVWTAAPMNPENRSGRYTLVGRVAEGQTLAHMDGPLRALANLLAANFQYPNPQWDKTRNPSIRSAREFFVGDVKPALMATLIAMAVILLIACANLAALMLGQVDARATEISVRAALGATRQRLIQQLLAESLLLGASAGAIGAVLAVAGFQVLLQALPLGVLADTAHLDWRRILGLDDGGARRGGARRRRAWRSVVARRQSPGRARHDAHWRRRHAWGSVRKCAGGGAGGPRRSARRRGRPAHSQRGQSPRHRSGS